MEREARKTDQKFAVICYIAAVCISTILTMIVGATVDKASPMYLYFTYLFPQLSYIGVFAVMFFVRNKNRFSSLLKRENVKGKDYIFASVIAVGLLFFAILPNSYVQKLFDAINLKASVVVPFFNEWYDYLLGLVVMCILPAIGEELVFRKAFCDGMEEVADYKTVLLCGALFALSHLNPAQTVHQFFLGCVLAFVYVKTKNITLTMLMHFLNNCIALFLTRITGDEIWNNNLTVMIVSCVVGAAVFALGIYLTHKKSGKMNNDKTGKIEPLTIVLTIVLAVAWAIFAVLLYNAA